MNNSLDQSQKPPFQLTATCVAVASLFLSIAPVGAVTFSTPKGVSGTPRTQTSGGASRQGGQCFSQTQRASAGAMALVPPTTQALTVSDRPTFFVYVPPTTAQEASFSLQDDRGELYYQTKVSLPENGERSVSHYRKLHQHSKSVKPISGFLKSTALRRSIPTIQLSKGL